MKLYQVHERLFIRGELRPSHVPELTAEWVVVALTPTTQAGVAEHLGGRYLHYPLVDGKLNEGALHAVDLTVKATQQVWRHGYNVLVHCRGGRNRAALVAALTLRQLTGCTGTAAVDHVRAVRPGALANPYFEAHLRGLP